MWAASDPLTASGAEICALDRAQTLKQRVALALFDDEARAGDVFRRLAAIGGWAADTLRRVDRGAHDPDQGDLKSLVNETRDLARKLAEVAPR